MNIIIEGTHEEANEELTRLYRVFSGNIVFVGLESQDEKRITYLVQQTEKDRPRQRTILQHRIFITQDSQALDAYKKMFENRRIPEMGDEFFREEEQGHGGTEDKAPAQHGNR